MVNKLPKIEKTELILFIFAVTVVAFLSLWRSFEFDFWRDDWGQLWAAIYHPNEFINNWAAVKLHPISAYEQWFLVRIFKLNPFLWQTWGYILKIIDSVSIALLVFILTRSKKSALFTGILFAAFLGGIETVTWVSAHTSALVIPLLCLGFYFWISSERSRSIKDFILSLIIFLLTIISDPSRALGIIALALFWEFLMFLQVRTNKKIKYFIERLFGLVVIFIISRPFLIKANFPSLKEIFSNSYKEIIAKPQLVKNILYSTGNLFSGWLIKIHELGGLSNPTKIAMRVSLVFLVFLVGVGIYFLYKRKESAKAILFLGLWSYIFYIPNWLFDKTLVVGTSHRYVSLAAPAVAGIIGILLSLVKNKRLGTILFFIFVGINIFTTNRILKQEWNFRSVKVVEALWDKVDNDVPKGEKGSIFMYMSADYLMGVAMSWSFSMPFGIRRGYTDVDEFPIVTGDRELIIKLICEGNVERPSVGKWSLQKEKIPLSHLHAWEMNNGKLKNVSDRERALLAKDLKCKFDI